MKKSSHIIEISETEKLFVSNEEHKILSYVVENDTNCKTLDFIHTSEFIISATYIDVEEEKEMKTYMVPFTISKENPLYEPFFNLLGDEEELILDDDASDGNYYRYIKIMKEQDSVQIIFSCTVTNVIPAERFFVFIKPDISKTNEDIQNRFNTFMDQILTKYQDHPNHDKVLVITK